MKYKFTYLTLFTILLISSCKTGNNGDFAEVKKLSEYKQTNFVTTLEDSLASDKNSIYAASFLFAWDEVEKEISDKLIGFTSPQLQQVYSTESHKNVLASDEYSSTVTVEGDVITAKADFKKLLAFKTPLKKHSIPFNFKGTDVKSFGFEGQNFQANIIYYYNDNDFAIKLQPKDSLHEIILVLKKFPEELTSLSKSVELLKKDEDTFQDEKNSINKWKYSFHEADKVQIPMFNFNLETNYSEMEGSHFNSADTKYLVEIAYQRTAFILDESGAKVESESLVQVTEESKKIDIIEEQKPKNLIFDKPFLIFLKRKDNINPYFAMFSANRELMQEYSG